MKSKVHRAKDVDSAVQELEKEPSDHSMSAVNRGILKGILIGYLAHLREEIGDLWESELGLAIDRSEMKLLKG